MDQVSNLQDFVMMAGDRLVTDSRKVARHFGKRHGDVLRAADNVDCSPEFNERNFASIDYVDARGRVKRAIQMTKDGFMFLVMGFTGKTAARMKEAFIAAFNSMAEQLHTGTLHAIQELLELEARNAGNFARASTGARWMVERKHWLPKYRQRRPELLELIQLPLFPQLT